MKKEIIGFSSISLINGHHYLALPGAEPVSLGNIRTRTMGELRRERSQRIVRALLSTTRSFILQPFVQ